MGPIMASTKPQQHPRAKRLEEACSTPQGHIWRVSSMKIPLVISGAESKSHPPQNRKTLEAMRMMASMLM